mmetsp:Transcript_13522/g.25376  ORF Transcript_13522/g.25376 Transcript_13522/m.25376 type:complete len:479 (-) Transcript_13522:2475-3911(-)
MPSINVRSLTSCFTCFYLHYSKFSLPILVQQQQQNFNTRYILGARTSSSSSVVVRPEPGIMAVQQQLKTEQFQQGNGVPITTTTTRRRSERIRMMMTSSSNDASSSSSSSFPPKTTSLKQEQEDKMGRISAEDTATKGAPPNKNKRSKNASHDDNDNDNKEDDTATPAVKRNKKTKDSSNNKEKHKTSSRKKIASEKETVHFETDIKEYLPRTREKELRLAHNIPNLQVIGIDEAGRGPLAGPVVAAAAIIPTDIPGVMDSKKLTKEEDREALYDQITSSPNARWSVAIGDASRIDEINILQATLECMRNAANGVMNVPLTGQSDSIIGRREMEASSKYSGCYIVCGINDEHGMQIALNNFERVNQVNFAKYYALIDGNRCPKDMPCESESMVKGDSREYAIAAASILAKVTRDRLMREYDAMYPEYELKRHKGYPTSAHMACVKKFGASPIHRRTFAPLKHMSFDNEGRIIVNEGAD